MHPLRNFCRVVDDETVLGQNLTRDFQCVVLPNNGNGAFGCSPERKGPRDGFIFRCSNDIAQPYVIALSPSSIASDLLVIHRKPVFRRI
jgi:hypothetical protein